MQLSQLHSHFRSRIVPPHSRDSAARRKQQRQKSSYVFYSHKKDGKEFSNLENNPAFDSFGEIVLCSDFDDLLNLLEVDAVEGIVFDQSVGLQEVNYLTRWARIFKPALKCLQYQISRRSPNAAFFSSTQI